MGVSNVCCVAFKGSAADVKLCIVMPEVKEIGLAVAPADIVPETLRVLHHDARKVHHCQYYKEEAWAIDGQ